MAKGDPEEFEERAAIREYDGGFSREEAERLARLDLKMEDQDGEESSE
jgi:hypothetical protein